MPQLRAQFVLFDGFGPLDVIVPFDAHAGESRTGRLPRTRVTSGRTSA